MVSQNISRTASKGTVIIYQGEGCGDFGYLILLRLGSIPMTPPPPSLAVKLLGFPPLYSVNDDLPPPIPPRNHTIPPQKKKNLWPSPFPYPPPSDFFSWQAHRLTSLILFIKFSLSCLRCNSYAGYSGKYQNTVRYAVFFLLLDVHLTLPMTFVLGMNCTCCVRVEFVLCARCVLRFNFGLGNLHTLTFQFNNSGAYLKHSKGYITWNPEALSIFIFPNHIYIKIIVFQYFPAYAQLPRLVPMCYPNYWLLNN